VNSTKPPAIRLSTLLVVAVIAVVTVFSGQPGAFSLSGPVWAQAQTPYYINSANLDLAGSAAAAAVRAGADTWLLQAGAFRFAYAGPSTQTTTTNDQINLVLFRDAANGSAIATTYWWSSGSRIIDADIVFWDGGFTFFAGTTGCSGGFYLEDIAAHEFGHVLGLGHSAVAGATMYPSVSSCNTGNRTLDPDDISGVRALYPPPPTPSGVRIIR
jgi:hypothetical protein